MLFYVICIIFYENIRLSKYKLQSYVCCKISKAVNYITILILNKEIVRSNILLQLHAMGIDNYVTYLRILLDISKGRNY